MSEESMARLGFAIWLQGLGYPHWAAVEFAFSRDPDVFAAVTQP